MSQDEDQAQERAGEILRARIAAHGDAVVDRFRVRLRRDLSGLGLLLLLPVSPIAVAAAILTARADYMRKGRRWRIVAAASALLAAAVYTGEVLLAGGFESFHYSGVTAAVAGQSSWWAAIPPTIPFGTPVGVAAGAIYAGLARRLRSARR
jgi:hypothetical protein